MTVRICLREMGILRLLCLCATIAALCFALVRVPFGALIGSVIIKREILINELPTRGLCVLPTHVALASEVLTDTKTKARYIRTVITLKMIEVNVILCCNTRWMFFFCCEKSNLLPKQY